MKSNLLWLWIFFEKRPIKGAATKIEPTKHITKKTIILLTHFGLL